MLYAARRGDLSLPLLSAILPSNELQIRRAVETVVETRKRRVGVVGLAFKAGTDDLRESPLVALVETLIGKGYDVRVLDGSVSLARLAGANRRFIEEEIPHIASLMCGTVPALLDHAEVVVIGSPSEEAARVLAAARPDQVVVDLTRGALGPSWRLGEPGRDGGRA
jgi:GDP-mannose 6-dehydrogenase